ncbi:MAG TPA: alpha/beta fold hydrolase [Terriglobales bacterium]|nr:alpha/beta fold hydrolase [Terriglobales bacterium]
MIRLLFLSLVLIAPVASVAQQGNVPRIEPSDCIYKADSLHKTWCGFLIVPENRNHPQGRTIKLPFIYVQSNSPDKSTDPVLYTGGGPGVSSLHPVTSIARRSLLKDRDYIAFEQRGTHFAQPNLECDGDGKAIQEAYLEHRSIDEAVLSSVRQCREKLIKEGIDLSAYNTDENASDIEDLRRLLHLDSLNLMGISYSGGLMMAVLQKYPEHIRSLILDSPLPEFVNIDEQELANFNEALTSVLGGNDTTLLGRFHSYFGGLGGKVFSINYQLKDGKTVALNYGRSELLSILHDKVEDYDGIKALPQTINDMIDGRQEQYVKAYFDGVFSGSGSISGMRLSVYCSDKMAFEDPDIIKQQETVMPWLAGFHVNDVYGAVCDAWRVKPISATTKKPYYSNVPALLGAGGLDDACRPMYNDLIHHYFPNSQRLLFTKRVHGPLLNSFEGDVYIGEFLSKPHGHLQGQQDIEAY